MERNNLNTTIKRWLIIVLAAISNIAFGQETLQTVTDRGNITTNSLQIGGHYVNANTTKLFINNPNGKNWALSSGANMITENGFNIYNWTDNSTTPLFTISNDGKVGIGAYAPQAMLDVQGAAIINGPAGNTLTLQKVSNNNPALAFKGLNSFSVIEAGDDQFSVWVGNNYRLSILKNGNVGIGTTTPTERLTINGKIKANEIRVDGAGAPDYVFEEGYKVGTLEALESYIKANKHLPEIPSAKEQERNGMAVGEMNRLLLKKVEELTLHLIEKDKQISSLMNRVDVLEKKTKK